MPENEIEIVREFETTLKNQDEEDEGAYEKIKEAYCEAFEKVDNYNRISLIKLLMHYHQNLGCEIFREMTKSHIEKVVE
jgi:hypothetical protein